MRNRAAGKRAKGWGRRRRRDREEVAARLRVREPEDFVVVVPYLLGFHPRDSLVALFFDDGRVALTARFDLPGVAHGPVPAPPSMAFLADRIADLVVRTGAGSVVLVCYTDSVEAWPELDDVVRDDRLPVREAVQVSPERWRSLVCTNDGCCPPEGTAYDLSDHPLAAEAVFAGLHAVPDRTALEEWVAGPPAADVDWLEQLAADELLDLIALPVATRQRLMRHRVEQSLTRPDALSDSECAELAALCVNLAVRDVAWALMTREDIGPHLALWRRVVSRTAETFAAGPLGLASIAAWLSGNGALLNCGIERLSVIAPDYGLLGILADVSNRAVPPSAWEPVGADLRRELKLAQ